MLKRIIISNFQSHKYTEFELGSITVVHGLSDSGKSAIRKAIQCVVYKSPFYIRTGKDVEDGRIRLEFDDYVIERYVKLKNKRKDVDKIEFSKDVYIINDKTEYERFGVELPQNIINDLKIFIHKIDSKSVTYNMMSQFDDMFFIGRTYDSIRNKMINMLVPDCDIVGVTIQNFKDEKNEETSALRHYRNYVDEVDAKLQNIDENAFEKLEMNIEKVITYSNSLNDKKTELSELKRISETLSELPLINIELDKYKPVIDNYKNGVTRLNSMIEKRKNLHDILDVLSDSRVINLTDFDISDDLKKVNKLCDDMIKIKKKCSELQEIGLNLKDIDKKVQILDTDIENAKTTLQNAKKEYSKNGVVCPITGKLCKNIDNKA